MVLKFLIEDKGLGTFQIWDHGLRSTMVQVENLEEFILGPFTCIKRWHFFSFALNSFFSHFFIVCHISNLMDCTRFILFNVVNHYWQCLLVVSLFISRHSFIIFLLCLGHSFCNSFFILACHIVDELGVVYFFLVLLHSFLILLVFY